MPTDRTFADQMGRKVVVPHPPKRIISIVPSQTELLFDLRLDEKIIGITKFCIHPASKIAASTRIGGTKKLDIELIKSLQPDLIIANKEENEQTQVEALAKHFPVWVSDFNDLDGALEMIKSIGELTGKQKEALDMANSMQILFNGLAPLNNKTVAYLIWRKPYMLAGKETFIDNMLQRCGFINVSPHNRYPEVTVEQLAGLDPQLVLLSSEPYPFRQKHADELQHYLPQAKICLVDGEMFSWYGSRLLKAVPYFKELIKSFVA